MGNRRRFLLALLALLWASPATAQQNLWPMPAYYVGEGEVDLWRGVFLYSNKDVSIGPSEADGGLTLTRFHGVRKGSDWGHEQEMQVEREKFTAPGDPVTRISYYYHVVIGRINLTFEWEWGSTQTTWNDAYGGTFVIASTAGPYTYTDKAGTVYNFSANGSCARHLALGTGGCAMVNSRIAANGVRTDFYYDTLTDGIRKRLRLVTTNRGYALGFNYQGSNSAFITQVCAVNLAFNFVTAAAPCPAGVRSATYTYVSPTIGGNLLTYTDPAGQVTTLTHSAGIATITNPGSSAPDLTNTYHPMSGKLITQTYANGASWNYLYENMDWLWEDLPANGWTEVTDPLSHMTRHNFGPAQPGPSSVVDPLSRTKSFTYFNHLVATPERTTEPEGNYTHNTYGVRWNVTEVRQVAKPGSGLADIVTSQVFPATCPNLKTCNKPTSKTDARGGVTDYTYDATHGGVLTETGPGVNVGTGTTSIRPVKSYTYEERHAWIKNSGGTYVQAATPSWVLASEWTCKTTAATATSCGGGAADKVTTAYEYGPNSGANNLLLRGTVVDSGGLSLRTCYTYDQWGNRISETQPKGVAGACP